MAFIASAFPAVSGTKRVGLALAIALCLPQTISRASEIRVPSCAQFVEFGRTWVGLDEERLAQGLGIPLYELTDGDIDLIAQAMRSCALSAASPEAKAILGDELKHIASLRAARDRVRRAYAAFESAKKRAGAKLEQIASRLDALPPSPQSRIAVDDAAATVSAIFFELEQKRVRAQVKQSLTENFPPYGDAAAALQRKRSAYAVEAQNQLTADAEDAFEKHHAEFERLDLPADAQDASIILAGIDRGKDVRWLTLRQWVSLALDNAENTSVTAASPAADTVEINVVRPGYSSAVFAFRQDGRDLRLVRAGTDSRSSEIETPDQRREANRLLIEVARAR